MARLAEKLVARLAEKPVARLAEKPVARLAESLQARVAHPNPKVFHLTLRRSEINLSTI